MKVRSQEKRTQPKDVRRGRNKRSSGNGKNTKRKRECQLKETEEESRIDRRKKRGRKARDKLI
jgi:hypothetical protein